MFINVAVKFWHPKGQKRLVESISKYGLRHRVWENTYPKGCPEHNQIPYAFKPYAFKDIKDEGLHKMVVWCDAAVWAQHNPTPIFDKIKQDGYFVLRNGWSTGNWSSDEQLKAFGYTREEAYSIPHAMACIVGLNFDHPAGQTIFKEYFENIHLFKGSWKNEDNQLGDDPRIFGTRHDQTILSLIMHKHGFNYTDPEGWIHYVSEATPLNKEAIFLSQGMAWDYRDYYRDRIKEINRKRSLGWKQKR